MLDWLTKYWVLITAGLGAFASFIVAKTGIAENRTEINELKIEVDALKAKAAEDHDHIITIKNDVAWLKQAWQDG